jgi:hypothetical protein
MAAHSAITLGRYRSLLITTVAPVRTLDAVAATAAHLATATVTTSAAQAARHDLQKRAIALMDAYELDVGGPAGQRRAAERAWPAVAIIQRLAYRTLNACWAAEQPTGQGRLAGSA